MAKEKHLTAKEAQKITSELKKSFNSKDVTVGDVMKWLFDGNPNVELPNKFMHRQYKLGPIINAVIQKFRSYPKMLNFMNYNVNDLFSKRSNGEILIFIKQYIQINRVTANMMDNSWVKKSDREVMLEKLSKTRNDFESGFNDIVSHYDLLSTGRFDDALSKSIMKEVSGEDINNSTELDETFLQLMEMERQSKLDKDPRFIKELNPEQIELWGLSLIDIKTIDSLNKILLIFLDKNNNKKFFLLDFVYEFVLSNIFSIIHNDYIMPFLPDYHQSIILTEIRALENLRRTLRDERDKFYKQYGWIENDKPNRKY